MSANVDLIRAIYDAFAAGDVPGILGRLDPAIEWHEAENFPYADNSPYVGPEAVAQGVFLRCATEWDGFGVQVDEIVDGGSRSAAMSVPTRRPARRSIPRWRMSGASPMDARWGSSNMPIRWRSRASSAPPDRFILGQACLS